MCNQQKKAVAAAKKAKQINEILCNHILAKVYAMHTVCIVQCTYEHIAKRDPNEVRNL